MKPQKASIASHYFGKIISLLAALCFVVAAAHAQTTAFTYQGRITDSGIASPSATYEMEFKLYDAASAGTQIGQTITNASVLVSNGIFTVQLDFGANAFPGSDRFLEISMRHPGDPSFTTLAPRQPVTSTPYAVRSVNATLADTATNSNQLGGVAANQYVQTSDSRLSDARPPTVGSSSYIQNTTSAQSSSNFNIAGDGTVGGTLTGNIVNATTQYNIGGSRVLGITGAGSGSNSNTFVGVGAGVSDMPSGTTPDGNFNSFFGQAAGVSNSTGSSNSFFGQKAGFSNTTGNFNSYFGQEAGAGNTNGVNNAFFGYQAGLAGTGNSNSAFFGYQAGMKSVSVFNSFFGASAGSKNISGFSNAFFGSQAGFNNTTGVRNTFVGDGAGFTNTTGGLNASIGYGADVASGNLINATAIGALAQVSQSNSLVLGSINGVNFSSVDTNVGIGTTAPTERLTIKTATSSYGFIHTDGTITVGSFVGGSGNGGYLGTKSNHPLHLFVNDGPPSLTIDTSGNVRIVNLGSAGATQLCRNASNQISTCSSSLRYKTNVASFRSGLNLVNRLQPITFNWKAGGQADLGLAAEDVAKVEPLLVTYNDQGEVEGVKYDRVAVVLLNAVKQQQTQLAEQRQLIQKQNAQFARQQKQIERQQLLIENLWRLACSQNPRANVCK